MTIEQLQQFFPTATTDAWHQHSNGGGWVANTATVPARVRVPASSVIGNSVWIDDNVAIDDNVRIGNNVRISNNVRIGGDAVIGNNVWIGNYTVIGNSVWIDDGVWIGNSVRIGDDAEILHQSDLIELRNVGTDMGVLAMYRTKYGVRISRGCYRNGTLEDFLSRLTDCPEHEFYRQVVPLMHAGLLRRMTPLEGAAEKGEVK